MSIPNNNNKKRNVLVFTDWFLPGFKGGGPIQTIAGMIENLSDDIQFYVVTRDRDLGGSAPYPNITPEAWSQLGLAKIYYWPPALKSKLKLLISIKNINYDIIYLNSAFSAASTIFPLCCYRLGLLKKAQIVIAPRGELSLGALMFKSIKKQVFLAVADWLGLYTNVSWHASSPLEKAEILKNFKTAADSVTVAPNLSPKSDIKKVFKEQKSKEILKLVTLSRISRKKNISYTLELLSKVQGEVIFHIFGPVEDQKYWTECLDLIQYLPANITITYKGEILHEHVHETLSRYHYFVFPSLGENYGHVIREAMTAGLPVIISNRTPWRNLEAKEIGWDLPLEHQNLFVNVVQQCLQCDDSSYQKASLNARQYAMSITNNIESVKANRMVLKM